MRMKRTNLVLDEQLLEEAVRLGGARTYSQAVNEALADYTRRIKARKILQLAGCGLWEGIWPKCARIEPNGDLARLQPMVLVDTSVWIEVFRKGARAPCGSFLDLDEAVTCLPVIQEVLQGFRDQRAFRIAHEAMHALPIVESPLRSVVFEQAIDLYRQARRQGLTIRSGVDCLIAACALSTFAGAPS